MSLTIQNQINEAAEMIRNANYVSAFTGAGISVESGVPAFRGAGEIWGKYAPETLEISYFLSKPVESWKVILEIFYEFDQKINPNKAHIALAKMEKHGILKAIITQNIDNLHQESGSEVVHEFHGNMKKVICLDCSTVFDATEIFRKKPALPPLCPKCNIGMLKPDFVFFGEGIPEDAYNKSFKVANQADLFIVIGTTGEVMPACYIPTFAKRNGCKILEINPEKSAFTDKITDLSIRGKAGEIMDDIIAKLNIQ